MRATLEKILARALVFLMAVMVFNVTWQVLSRYLAYFQIIDQASTATEEMARFLLIWLGLLGAAYASARHMHLAIDLLLQRSSPARVRRLERLINVLVIIFAAMAMVWGGGYLVYLTFALEQTSAAIGLPLGVVYLVIPVSGILIVYFAVDDLIHPDATPVQTLN
jgi:TRAP-type C4-dicarboxylate transport system permease small subunit